MNENLNDYYKNIYSQRGEDGIIEEICKRLNLNKGACIEFGAGDGVSISNTKNLIDKGWNAFLIESNHTYYRNCVNVYKNNSRVICLNKAVDIGENSIEKLIEQYFKLSPDIISIDIDGKDFEIFKKLQIKPKLLIIECNPYRNPLDRMYHGPTVTDLQESLTVFNEEAAFKGYKIICYTQNIFLIRNDHAHLFNTPTDIMALFINGFIRSYHLETDDQEKHRIYNRISKQFGLDNLWLKPIIEKYCNG
jgi:hypothetical protein